MGMKLLPDRGPFKTKIIAEVGISHNGDLDLAKELILTAKAAGCDFVKFQKRDPDICVPEAQKNTIRNTPWGSMTYLEYKYKVEFGAREFTEIDRFCSEIGIGWFTSVWDRNSVDFMAEYVTKVDGTYKTIMKIPSALITDHELIKYARSKSDILLMSTGMSTQEEIDAGIKIGNPDVVMHTNSTYPSPVEELNLNYITSLKKMYPDIEIGYSGHEYGLVTTFAAVAMGATWIERHITMDRTLWGSDQSSSVEPSGFIKLVKGIRDIEKATAEPESEIRVLYESELNKRKSLRGV